MEAEQEESIIDERGPVPSAYGIWLRAERSARGWEVHELQARSGVTGAQIYNIESGRSANPQARTRERLNKALEAEPPANVIAETTEAASVDGLPALELLDFDPHEESDLPDKPGVYVFYDSTDRPVYVGESSSISKRIRSGHYVKFWFKQPLVQRANYVEIANKKTRRQFEKMMIKFLRSTALLNQMHVVRPPDDDSED